MVERNASDLHLCVGMSPLVRKDGEIRPLDPALDDIRLRLVTGVFELAPAGALG